ncbi:MAG: hypothetical protein DMD71_07335 [Gemmatimonadetes bacterium]|nr:MAG: hypothetical protein DMD71_07335 [Gemmatimonadota bacterium]
MRLVRHVIPAFIGGLLWAAQLGAQDSTGTITGQVIDSTSQQPLSGVNVSILGTSIRTVSRNDGGFVLGAVPAGAHRLRATRIGYLPQEQDVTVTPGGAASVRFVLHQSATILEAVVVTGYGTQRREAITGSVATIDPAAANVGVTTNVNQMLQGRAAGVEVITNNGEPGAGAQVRIRGGTSLSASNEPLYVIDGVPINSAQTEANTFGIGGDPPLPRSPLNLLNPSDIASITVLKDASATAIYGSRAANGVVLIETKKHGTSVAGAGVEYDGYVAMATPSRYLNVLDGAQYRQFVQQQVQVHYADPLKVKGLDSSYLAALGPANTNWERAVTRTAVTHNHNVSFTGGSEDTRYRASLNYMNEEGVALSSGLERIQGRLNATHNAFDNRLRLGLNVTTSQVNNDYLPYEVAGGFEGGVFQNVAVYNPTRPITYTDSTGVHYYEIGAGSQSVRNPVAMANQVQEFGHSTRTLGNVSAEVDLVPGVTGQVNVGVDRADGLTQIYLPALSPVGAQWNGLARQVNRNNAAVTLQTLLTLRRQLGANALDVVGGYEYSKYSTEEFGAEGHGYVTDNFSFNNLGAAAVLVAPYSYRNDRVFVSFFSRANYSLRDKYYVTGVLRYDGASQFGIDHKWALFPALSASWHLSRENFMANAPLSLSDLRLRVGYGLQGNPAVPAYASQILLATPSGARYIFGESPVTGVIPTSDPNPNLKWEQTAQYNLALDYGFMNNRFTGTIEYYVKNTKDLILTVTVPPPAPASTRLENVGKIRNRGLEWTLDAVVVNRPGLSWRAGLVFAAERNTVVDLGPYTFLTSGGVSGQGQTGQVSQRIFAGHPLGTFYGPVFVGWDTAGKQLFRCSSGAGCVNGQTLTPGSKDYAVIGNANPDFTLGVNSQVSWGKFNISALIRAEVGQDVFNNTALVYSTKSNALQGKNFLSTALNDPTGIKEPAIFSSRWIEKGTYLRLQNLTVDYQLTLPGFAGARSARAYVSGDNLLLLTGYSGYDPEVQAGYQGLGVRGIDYLSYPRPRTITGGLRVAF